MHWIVIYPVDSDVYLSNYMAYVYVQFVRFIVQHK